MRSMKKKSSYLLWSQRSSENVCGWKETVLIAEQIVIANQVIADHRVLELWFGEVVVQMIFWVVVAGETRIVQEMICGVVRIVAGQCDRRRGRRRTARR